MSEYFIGIDVGSFSVRAGLFLWNKTLKLIEKNEQKIDVYNDKENFYEQSIDNIWSAICFATKMVLLTSDIDAGLVKGISFDATCSLVATDQNDDPVTISKSSEGNRNVIMWMDHRAIEETDFINKTNHPALMTVGGKISVEMQPPKLLWLKKNVPQFMSLVSSVFDLPDYLTFRATGSKIRSLCSVTCKWAFDAENKCWDRSFWESCGLSELCENDFEKIGNTFCLPGFKIGGLSKQSAIELGLMSGISVPGSLIDAYAGMLGAMSDHNQIVTIAGTSACHMILTSSPIYITGIWGPFKNVLIADDYVLEAGQSAVGVLLDRMLRLSSEELSHEGVIKNLVEAIGVTDLDHSDLLSLPADKWFQINVLAKNIHINPDFLGNRSPRSDPDVRGSMIGVSMDSSASYVSKIYLATVQALGYGFKEILQEIQAKSVRVDSIKVCGGLTKNPLYLRVFADISGLPILVSPGEDLVLRGTGLLNVMNEVDIFKSNKDCIEMMISPDTSLYKFHQDKFEKYLKIIKFQMNILK